jgi:hypothetical protein
MGLSRVDKIFVKGIPRSKIQVNVDANIKTPPHNRAPIPKMQALGSASSLQMQHVRRFLEFGLLEQ